MKWNETRTPMILLPLVGATLALTGYPVGGLARSSAPAVQTREDGEGLVLKLRSEGGNLSDNEVIEIRCERSGDKALACTARSRATAMDDLKPVPRKPRRSALEWSWVGQRISGIENALKKVGESMPGSMSLDGVEREIVLERTAKDGSASRLRASWISGAAFVSPGRTPQMDELEAFWRELKAKIAAKASKAAASRSD